MSAKDKLLDILVAQMTRKGLRTKRHQERLRTEVHEIDIQVEHEYFLELYERGCKFERNENNLFVAYLLDLSTDFDINREPEYGQGEFPDIDSDFLPAIQPYLKDVWAPKQFGRQNVCNIGNYTTFAVRSSLIDMARLFGEDRNEILAITKALGRDEEGKAVSTLDAALPISKELRLYCEEHKELADATRRLIGRNRGRGKHAGGLVISSIPIDELVPLITDSDGNPVSAWTEGQHDQDLQPVGLVKYDVLVVKDLLRVAVCTHLVKQRHNLESICAKEGQSNWTDTVYLNDPIALALANEGKTKGVFQFDSDGMREMVKRGGVDTFEDLVAYSSLYRPAAIGMGMHDRYIDRKRGEEEWLELIPDLIKPILEKTYGVMVYQEQVMRILNVVGDIPLIQCEKLRKAISKKKEKFFARYKQMFVDNGQPNLGWTREQVINLWDQVASFSGYGFNRSHALAYTVTSMRLLYLKAHFPLEFYAVTLGLESKANKICSYKREAEKADIVVNRIDMNRSKENFAILDGEIFIGFGNIKQIGDEVAKRIVACQPYSGLEDFLNRFGTDAKPLTALIELGAFPGDRALNKAFYEHYKVEAKKRNERAKRCRKTRDGYLQQIIGLAETELTHEYVESASEEEVLAKYGEGAWNIIKKYQKCLETFNFKEARNEPMTLSNFEPKGLPEVPDIFEAEATHYGFSWRHPIEKSPDYSDNDEFTFAAFDDDDTLGTGMVEVMLVKKPEMKASKKGHNYHQIIVEDVDRCRKLVTIWDNDYQRFREEFEFWDEKLNRGHLLKMRVVRPGPGFSSFTFQSYSRRNLYLMPREKEDDHRLIVMAPPIGEIDELLAERGDSRESDD